MLLFGLLVGLLCSAVGRLQAQPASVPSSQPGGCSSLTTNQNGPQVFLTISSLAGTSLNGKTTDRQIELNWYFRTFRSGTRFNAVMPGDWVGLFQQDPADDPAEPLVQVSAMKHQGYFRTTVQFGRPPLAVSQQLGERCLGFWIAYVKRNETLASDCLKTRPTWMWDNRAELGDIPLHRLMVPGTHNSGSAQEYRGLLSENVFTRYLYCQEEDIWSQLVYGIRYLDIRVGYYSDTSEKFWINHDWAKMSPLRNLTNDVRRFLQLTNEVVILDIHRFPFGLDGMPERHEKLIQFLQSELGDFMADSSLSKNATMNELWRRSTTLIVSYADSDFSDANDKLWPRIMQEWGNKNNAASLKRFLEVSMSAYYGHNLMWAAMAHLTKNTLYAFFNPTQGVRVFADVIHKNVTSWFLDLWWDKANIVCTDYFLSNNIISVSIQSNLRRICNEEHA